MCLARNDRAIELYYNATRPDLQLLKQSRDALSFENILVFAVNVDSHGNKKTVFAPTDTLAREYGLKFTPAAQTTGGHHFHASLNRRDPDQVRRVARDSIRLSVRSHRHP
jgi:hypothetical protein